MKISFLNLRIIFALIYDFTASGFAWYLAFLLRFNFNIPLNYSSLMFQTLLVVIFFQIFIFVSFGLYRTTWRFAGLKEVTKIFKIIAVSSLGIFTLLSVINITLPIPRSVMVLNPIILLIMIGGSRITYRIFNELSLYQATLKKGKPVIVFSNSNIAASLINNLQKSSKWSVVAMLSDDKTIHNREVGGVKVYGAFTALQKLLSHCKAEHIIIASHLSNRKEMRKIIEACSALGLKTLISPNAEDPIHGSGDIFQIRPIDVEDLLGRDVVDLDSSGLQRLLTNNVVMVSGAGGSIGSELCCQILKFNPSKLICLDISEYALYQLEQNLKSLKSHLVFVIGDVKNHVRLDHLLDKHQPKVVFHAAAYKHVPLMENENVSEAFSNNVGGTYTLAKACKNANVSKFVLVSTDKAVNPTNVMGATKRLAEIVCQGLQEVKGTRFAIVRFGNVLGSSGSVIPKFSQQIKAGGPITVTHPEITRYFMSIPEAAQLIMQAGLMSEGGEIYVLDMGEPLRIIDLAKDMIKLSGLEGDEIAIEFSGLRPGEKLYEELLTNDESALPTSHAKLRIISTKLVDIAWVNKMLKWVETIISKDEVIVKQELKTWLEEYTPDFKN
jgi:FlaA1/EpsC-like NDP-sugar epimerase